MCVDILVMPLIINFLCDYLSIMKIISWCDFMTLFTFAPIISPN